VSTRPYFRANLFEKLGGHIYEGRNLFPRNLLYLCGLIIKNMEAKHIAQETIVPHNQRYENEGYTDWEIFLLNHDPFTSRFSLLAENLWKQYLKNLLLPWGKVINSTCYPHAEKLGFFVIKATGSSSSLVDSPDFVQKAF